MARILILLIGFLTIGATALTVSYTNTRPAVPQRNVPARSVPAPPGQLPPRLNPPLPDIAEIPDNPCSKLVIPDDAQRNVPEFAQTQQRAQERAVRLLKRYSLPAEIKRGDPERKAVALTIDTGTGGSQGIEPLLAIAVHYHIPLTFFVTGCWTVENPELLQRIAAEGHSIANHTLTHINLAETSDENVNREIAETDRLLRETTGMTPILFRKPLYTGGQRVVDIAGRLGKLSVLGFPDFGDTTGWRKGTTADDVRTLVERKTTPGAIWVFHNLSLADLGAFEDIIRFHLKQGYALVSVEDLLAPPEQ